jgi:neutral ceramidase
VKAKFLRELRDQGEEFITSYSAPLQVVRFGNELLIIALSGEPVVDWAHKFKREFERCVNSDLEAVQEIADTATPASVVHGRRYPLVWVAGYCNDIFDYLPTRRIPVEGGYEGGRANLWNPIPAPVTREAEHLITKSVRDLVQRVSE